ncbi:hypothetical protein EW146_g4319 [Bondarzewia mesenterica]|uniref:HMG box domain-containing protein n=1 Tax=Bondarzewia mesenterica TaxID=1095465 RepID=A0A4S4LUX1_9AGAM|nr:hypothetical protein EW146_g4319 [Bondarzewia mesenterica]
MLNVLIRRAVLRAPALAKVYCGPAVRTFVTTTPSLFPARATATRGVTKSASSTKAKATTAAKTKAKPKAKPKPKPKAKAKPRITKARAKPKPKAPVRAKVKPEDKPPRRPVNGYLLFYQDFLKTRPKSDSRQQSVEYVREAVQAWHALPSTEQQGYQSKASALLDEYKEKFKAWKISVNPEVLTEINRRRKVRGLGKIRKKAPIPRPANAWFRFLKEVRERHPVSSTPLGQRYPIWITATAHPEWLAMSAAEKAKYTEPYERDLAAWRQQCAELKA